MKPTKKPAKTPPTPPEDAEETTAAIAAPALEERDAVDEIAALLEGVGGNEGKVLIYRRKDGQRLFLGSVPVSEFSPELVADRFGGGSYFLRVRNEAGQWAGSCAFEVDPSAKPKAQPGATAPDPVSAEKLAELVAARLKTSEGGTGGGNALAWFAALSPVVLKLIDTLKPAPAAPLNESLLIELVKNQSNSTAQALEMIERAKELVPTARGGGGEERGSFWERIAEAAAPALAGALARNQPMLLGAGNNGNGTSRPALPTSPPAPALLSEANGAPSAVPTSPGGVSMTPASEPPPGVAIPPSASAAARINDLFNLILRAAEAEADPATYAELLEDQLEPAEFDQLANFLKQENWFEMLFAGNERAVKVREWLAELRGLVIPTPTPSNAR